MPNPLHEKCLGKGFTDEEQKFMRGESCGRIRDGACPVYPVPMSWWRHPGQYCPMATHYRPDLQVAKEKVRSGQQKQKKKH